MIAHDHDYLTVREAAELLRVSVPTIRRWIAAGRLRAVRLGTRSVRLRRSDVEEPLNGRGGLNGQLRERVDVETVERDERVARVDQLIAELREINRDILRRRGGKLLPSSVPLIRQARRARAAQL